MKKLVYEIDDDGFIVNSHVVESDTELAENMIDEALPEGLYAPKWTGTEWISTMTPEQYVLSLDNLSQEKSPLEILQETVDQLVLDALMGGA